MPPRMGITAAFRKHLCHCIRTLHRGAHLSKRSGDARARRAWMVWIKQDDGRGAAPPWHRGLVVTPIGLGFGRVGPPGYLGAGRV